MMMMNVTTEGRRERSAEGGGINWHMSVKDGETSYSRLHPTWIFTAFVHQVRLLQTCWDIPYPFRSLSTTYVVISMSAKKMKKDYYLHSSSVIVSAFRWLFRIKSTILKLSETLRAPHLRRLVLIGFVLPLRSQLLTTDMGLVTLALIMTDRSTRFHPNACPSWRCS
jgi:hypothetical protein